MGETPEIVVEYFGDFGFWRVKTVRFSRLIYVSGQRWNICSFQPLSDFTIDATKKLILERSKWLNVNLQDASNLKANRKPAMGKKRR
jgi:hypothetical protein